MRRERSAAREKMKADGGHETPLEAAVDRNADTSRLGILTRHNACGPVPIVSWR